MKIGYARVSTIDQNPDLQRRALEAASCDRIIVEHASGADDRRPKLETLLPTLGEGDILAVWRLDRLGRSLPHLIKIVGRIEHQGAHLHSVTEGIDTTTSHGRLTFHLMGALAEFERSLIVERTRAGLEAAKRRGAPIGRPKSLTRNQIGHARTLINAGERPTIIAQSLGISRATLYRALKGESNNTLSQKKQA